MADHPVIRKGSKGDAVRNAQTNLQARGYYPGAIDGLFGPQMDTAVKWYQSVRGLAADGIVGPRTWARLDPPTVKSGSTGQAVTMLQQLLTDYGYLSGAIDGQFGPNTESAVKAFQTDFHLAADGIVGPRTWAALGS